MSKRQTLALAAVLLGMFSAALPAAAQAKAPWWFIGGVKLGPAKVAVKTAGTWTSTDNKTGFKLGPCKYTDKENLWNGAAMGQDEKTEMIFAVPCATSVANCTITKAVAKKLPWPSSLVIVGKIIYNETTGIDIEFTLDNNAGCKGAGIGGKTFPVDGSVKEQVGTTGCLIDSEAEGLSIGEEGLVLNGEDCFEAEGGTVTAAEE